MAKVNTEGFQAAKSTPDGPRRASKAFIVLYKPSTPSATVEGWFCESASREKQLFKFIGYNPERCFVISHLGNRMGKLWSLSSRACPQACRWIRLFWTANSGVVSKAMAEVAA